MPTAGTMVKLDARNGRIRKRYPVRLDVAVSQGAAVSPDLKWFAYIQTRPPTGPPDCGESHCPSYALYLTRVKDNHRVKVTNDTGNPSWSPDAKRIAYVANGKITIDTVATGKKVKLATGTHVAQADAPSWQP